MPFTILNPELYADRTVQDWHRASFGRNDWAIDLDLMGACHRCREPLYLIEATTNPNKPTSILRNLAKRSEVPALVIFHDAAVVRSGRLIWPQRVDLVDERQVHDTLAWFRRQHDRQVHIAPRGLVGD